VALHPARPTARDVMVQICSKFMELHVDTAGEHQLVCGVGEMDAVSVMFIGHTRGWLEQGDEHRALATRLMQVTLREMAG
jgi:acetyl-CoA carboxylase alpha subunit